jgi:putative SOS response-associated peptidase YedK
VCGRYVVKTPIKTIAKMHRVFDAPLFEPRYNVAPTQTDPIVRAKAAGRELALVRWGLIPAWAKDAKIGYRLINARADTVAIKPSFRSAFKRRRYLVPADGFYEWQKVGKVKGETSVDANEPVAVYTSTNLADAEIIKTVLESEGIKCILDGENQGSFAGVLEARLLVRAKDAERARYVLKARGHDDGGEVPGSD